ncbi:RcnB family protein [Sphingomonas sp.]|uniref:RcnB family protein n=1 Tax=Sphingomonas sp. TaxID=28214 RepID=UPI0031CF00B0
MRKHLIAALLAATTVVAGTTPALVNAQDRPMDRGPGGRPEGPRPGPGGPGGPAGRLERSEGRPVFHDREAFPENRPAYRPDHAEAPRPAPPPAGSPDRGPEGRNWGDRGDVRGGPRPAQPGPRPDQRGPDQMRGGRDEWRGEWRGQDRRRPQWQDRQAPGPRPDLRWGDAQRRDQRWHDEDRRRRDDRDRWQRSFGDWRDQDQQAYGFAERRAWAEQWNRGWRRDRRYDWMNWRSLNRGAYHLPRYYAPYRGDAYQRFSSGVILEPMFFGQSYWLDDPYAYRLPPAYGAYRWVRYYNDALLVDLRSGLVVDVVYDIFW